MDVGEFIPFPKIKISGTRTINYIRPMIIKLYLTKILEKAILAKIKRTFIEFSVQKFTYQYSNQILVQPLTLPNLWYQRYLRIRVTNQYFYCWILQKNLFDTIPHNN